MKVIIPIAGEGTRLRPHTHTKQKSMIPVAGKPMIDHIMDKFLPLHPTEFVFIVGYQRQRFEKYLREKYHDIPMRFVHQEVPLGTAHAALMAKEAFDEDVIIDFGDTLFDTDLSVIENCQDDAIIWAQHREDFQRFGVIVTDEQNYMTRMVEKPKEPISKLANIGLYWVRNTRLLAEAIEHTMQTKKPDREAYLTDSFQYMIEKGAKIKVLPVDLWFDCGTAEALLEANQELLARNHPDAEQRDDVVIIPPVFIDPSAVVEHSTIGPFVSISAGAEIRNSNLRNSIIEVRAHVNNITLTDSIIGQDAKVKGKPTKINVGDHSVVE
jgi:glucose-1-phosphate thymidylyltransferase